MERTFSLTSQSRMRSSQIDDFEDFGAFVSSISFVTWQTSQHTEMLPQTNRAVGTRKIKRCDSKTWQSTLDCKID